MSPIADAVAAVDRPGTADSLARDLRELGLEEGDVVLVHSSLKSLGWVVGGAQTVVEALMKVVGESGTIVMPTHSSDNSEPRHWENPPVPEPWWQTIREEMPAFDPRTTPTRGMGTIPEYFRTLPDVRRSYHPTDSFAAWGELRDAVVAEHELDFGLGDGSPLRRIYENEGRVLLLGVDHDRNTSLHLAEHRWGGSPLRTMGGAVAGEAGRLWVTWDDHDLDSSDFVSCGRAFQKQTDAVRKGSVGAATARLMPQRRLVDFAADWFARNRETDDLS